LQALNQWQITEGITPFGFARAAPPEHARVTLLGLKLRDQQRDKVAFTSAVLLEGLPKLVSDHRTCRLRKAALDVLFDGNFTVSQTLPKLVIDSGAWRFGAHEDIVASLELAYGQLHAERQDEK